MLGSTARPSWRHTLRAPCSPRVRRACSGARLCCGADLRLLASVGLLPCACCESQRQHTQLTSPRGLLLLAQVCGGHHSHRLPSLHHRCVLACCGIRLATFACAFLGNERHAFRQAPAQAMHAAGHRANTTPDASSMDGCSSFGSGWAPAPAGPALTQQQFPATHGAGDARASPEQLSAVPHWAAAQGSTHTLAPGGSSMAFTALPGAAHERWPATVPAAQTHGVPGLSPAASAAPNAAPRPPALATQPGAVCTAQQGWSAEYHAAYATPPHSMPQTTWGSGGTEHLGITAASHSAPPQLLGGSAQRSAQLGGLPRHDLLPVPATSSRGKFLGVSEKPKNGKFECRVYLGESACCSVAELTLLCALASAAFHCGSQPYL